MMQHYFPSAVDLPDRTILTPTLSASRKCFSHESKMRSSYYDGDDDGDGYLT